MRRMKTAAVALLGLVLSVAWLYGQGAPVVDLPTADTTYTMATSYTASAATTNATSVSATAANVYGYSLGQTNNTVYYLRMYDLAVAPTCSSATGFVESIMIPASTSGAGRERHMPLGQAFTKGIGFCITDSASSTGNGAAATNIQVTILFKK